MRKLFRHFANTDVQYAYNTEVFSVMKHLKLFLKPLGEPISKGIIPRDNIKWFNLYTQEQ